MLSEKFKDTPVKFNDPFWVGLAEQQERKMGLPEGSLRSILVYGERTNADRVSEAGARTPFQVIPQTRKAVIEKYGVDAYLSPENAAEAAALVLKEGLDRNKGDVSQAVGEYIGGTNRNNWGKITNSYIERVMKGIEQLIPAAEAGTLPQSFEANVLQAYRDGRMTPEQSQEFLRDVQSGLFALPAGETIEPMGQGGQPVQAAMQPGMPAETQTDVFELPADIADAYATNRLTRQQRAELEADIQSGLVRLPAGLQVQPVAGQEELGGLTLEGTTGAVVRGVTPVLAGATLGAAVGLPFAGVGAVPGAIAGAAAAGLATALGDPIVSGINSLLGTQYQMPTDALTDLLTRIGVPQATTEAEKIVQSVSGAVGAGVTGATAGRALQAASQSPLAREIGRQFAVQPGAQIAGATTGEIAGEVARREELGPAAEIAAQLVGGTAGAIGASRFAGVRIAPGGLTPQTQQSLDAAENLGIRTLTSDVIPPQTFVGRTAQSTGERIPFAGTGGIRQAQADERVAAVRDIIREYGGEGGDAVTRASDNVMRDLATQRSAALTQYSTAKNEVIDRLSDRGTVPLDRTIKQVDEEIDKLEGLRSDAFKPVIDVLNDWKQALQGQNLRNVEELRKQVGQAFTDPSLSGVRDTGQKALSRIYAPLKQDMTDFIRNNGERKDVTKFIVSNKRLADLAGELKSGTLKSILRRGDTTPEVINTMLFSQKPSDLQTLYRGLSAEGRVNAQMAIIARAAEKAGGYDAVSPERFVTELKRLGKPVDVFFRGEDLDRVQGLVKALKLTQRATVAAAAPPTGVQAVPFVAGSLLTDLLGGAGAATAGAVGVGLAARLFESKPMRQLLTRMVKVKPGSKEEGALTKRFVSLVESEGRQFESESE
jgi:hypothetical protein